MTDDNVIELFGDRKERPDPDKDLDSYEIFMEAMRKNKDNKDKLAQERERHNRTIVRNQRLHVSKKKPRK